MPPGSDRAGGRLNVEETLLVTAACAPAETAYVSHLVADPGLAEVTVATGRQDAAAPVVLAVGLCRYDPDAGPDLRAAATALDAAGWLVTGRWTNVNADLSTAPVGRR